MRIRFCFGKAKAWVSLHRSSAMTIPRAVTTSAVILMVSGMVIGGVFVGGI